MKAQTKARIDHIWYCLPCDSTEELTSKLNERADLDLTIKDVTNLVRLIRKNSEELGWIIPHVRRGHVVDGDGRFIRVLTDGSGAMIFDRDGDRQKLEDGTYGTVSHVMAMGRNNAKALRAAAGLTQNRIYREFLEDLAEDVEYLAKKAAKAAKIIKFNRAA
jgi:hypothetical protein